MYIYVWQTVNYVLLDQAYISVCTISLYVCRFAEMCMSEVISPRKLMKISYQRYLKLSGNYYCNVRGEFQHVQEIHDKSARCINHR